MNKGFIVPKFSILILCFIGVITLSVGVVLACVTSGTDWTYQQDPYGDYIVI